MKPIKGHKYGEKGQHIVGIFSFGLHPSYVQNTWQVTSESNEHTYGGWRWVPREFNMDRVIGIEEKIWNFTNTVFEGGL